MKLIIAFALGYILSLLIHTRLFKRLKDTYDYVTIQNYSLSNAWRRAGRAL